MSYTEQKELACGLVSNGKPIEQLSKKKLIKIIVDQKRQNDQLKSEKKAERDAGIMLLKDFVRNVKPNIN